jgi:hypothetical protein
MSACECEDDEDGLFGRMCGGCGFIWLSGHCEHDGIQRPCSACAWLPSGAITPMQWAGHDPIPGRALSRPRLFH